MYKLEAQEALNKEKVGVVCPGVSVEQWNFFFSFSVVRGIGVVQAELWLTPLLKERVRIFSFSGKGLRAVLPLLPAQEMIPSPWEL